MQQTNQRILPMEHGYNFRDLGGYQTIDGQKVQWQRVIRTASLAYLSNRDQQSLVDYGIKVDVDFRSNTEVSDSPDRIPAGIRYRHLPVFTEDKTDASKSEAELKAEMKERQENGRQHMIDVYQEMVTMPQAHEAYQNFFATLLANTDAHNAILFHCTAGKDRTGMGAAFFLSALGVPRKTVKRDYLLTNKTLSPLIQDRLKRAESEGITGQSLASVKALMSVSSDYFDAAMKAIETNYGSMQAFLANALELTDHDIADLKQLYLTH
ncbi:tyrosine-protein phosphatase [Secundilactobacillus folii]|uniref:Protein-tyrosine-phosphatase n=1 Tax=Secundilactobacillus folii TaxID=2678357 RepID=A0A7X2XW64_9LACO|nr:tyrosine-protein phosphatase [Secundilactobacillus folii]MTV82792.1 protein-tyrosine-phosphatase [Secundilactobacillus folii]